MDTLPSFFLGLFALLFCSAFVRIFTALTIFRFGLGLKQSGFGIIIFGFSLTLSMLIAEPIIGKEKIDNIVKSSNMASIEDKFRPFLEKIVDQKILSRIQEARLKNTKLQLPETSVPFNVLLGAFMLSELKVAFALGLLIIIPFLVIDLVVVNIFSFLGINQLSVETIAIPLKLLLFVTISGWELLTMKLITDFL